MKLITEVIEDVSSVITEDNGEKTAFIEGKFIQGDVKNRNGRVYPSQVLEREVNRYIQEVVNKNRAYGELGHPCFWDRTEALTLDGWKRIKDVEEGELVYSINKSTGNVELKKNIKTSINHYNGKLLHFKGRGIDTAVTPYHKMLLIDRNGKYVTMNAQEIYDRYKSDESKIKKMCIAKISNGVKEFDSEYTIKSKTFEISKLASFLGFYLAEGCTIKRKDRKNSYRIQVFQSNKQNFDLINSIDEMLNNLHEEISFKRRDDKNQMSVWDCYDKEFGEYLHQLGNCYNKYVPEDFIQCLDKESALYFLDWFIIGDGRGNLKEKYNKTDVFSVSLELIEDISKIATIAGIPFRMFTEICEKDYVFADRVIEAKNKKPLHFARFSSTKGVYLDNRFLKIEEVEWNDDVYCLTVEDNSTFMVKDGEYSFWTGNCGPAINLDKVSHMITNLHREGSDYIGKAKIIEKTPMGSIAKSLIEAGANLGVSTRGVGSLREKNGIMEVQQDFRLSTVDIVSDPSGPDCFVNGIMEGTEWYLDDNGWKQVEETKEEIEASVRSRELSEEKKVQIFEKFMKSLKS